MTCGWHEMEFYFGMKISACTLLASLVVGCAGLYLIWHTNRSWKMKKQLRVKLVRKQEERRQKADALEKKLQVDGVLVTPERERITSLSVQLLLKHLQEGSLKAVDVLHAYQAKALEATRKCNCVTEFIEEAEEWASALDSSTSPKAPLHGLPISMKDNYHLSGHDTTLGLAKHLYKPRSETSVLASAFRRLGSVPFCKTNVPQTLLSFGCENPVFGATCHPTHPDRTAGGSSGGEGSLVALGGSPLGLGSDIGGSVRIPAHFCGVAGIKPTGKRFSYGNVQSSVPHLPGILVTCSPGLLGKDVEAVVLASKAVLTSGILPELDPTTVPLPWREEIFSSKRKLRIGVCEGFPYFPPSPGMARALTEARVMLEKAGHETVPLTLPEGEEFFRTSIDILMSDGGIHFLRAWEHETIAKLLYTNKLGCMLPAWLKKAVQPLLALVSKRTALTLTAGTRALKSSELWEINETREHLIEEVTAQWRNEEIDACILPSLPFPAVGPRLPSILFSGLVYTLAFNLLDFPCGVVKITEENAQDQEKLKQYGPQGDNDLVFRMVRKGVEGGVGLPLSVQVVSFPWEEEMVLRVMTELQKSVCA